MATTQSVIKPNQSDVRANLNDDVNGAKVTDPTGKVCLFAPINFVKCRFRDSVLIKQFERKILLFRVTEPHFEGNDVTCR